MQLKKRVMFNDKMKIGYYEVGGFFMSVARYSIKKGGTGGDNDYLRLLRED